MRSLTATLRVDQISVLAVCLTVRDAPTARYANSFIRAVPPFASSS